MIEQFRMGLGLGLRGPLGCASSSLVSQSDHWGGVSGQVVTFSMFEMGVGGLGLGLFML